jgi:hypothetical protein
LTAWRVRAAQRASHFPARGRIDRGFGPIVRSSIALTFDVYGHPFPQEDDPARFAAGELARVG